MLILGGRVADLAGRRRTFVIGLALFAAASAGCALAWSPETLVGARLVQGAGAALLSPAALALLTTLTEPGEARRRAVGWWTAVASTQTGTDAAEPAYRGVTSGVLNSAAQVGTAVGVALLVPLATATGWAVMTGYRVGFLAAGVVALMGALSSFLIPPRTAPDRKRSNVPTVITCSSPGVVARKHGSHEGNDHHDHARTRRGAGW